MKTTTTTFNGFTQTETTTYYKDGKVKAILSITRTREGWKPLLKTDVHRTAK